MHFYLSLKRLETWDMNVETRRRETNSLSGFGMLCNYSFRTWELRLAPFISQNQNPMLAFATTWRGIMRRWNMAVWCTLCAHLDLGTNCCYESLYAAYSSCMLRHRCRRKTLHVVSPRKSSKSFRECLASKLIPAKRCSILLTFK